MSKFEHIDCVWVCLTILIIVYLFVCSGQLTLHTAHQAEICQVLFVNQLVGAKIPFNACQTEIPEITLFS